MENISFLSSLFDSQTLIVFLTVFFIVLAILSSKFQTGNLPPGPFSLPVLGTVSLLRSDVREPLKRLVKKYGDVFTVWLGSKSVVMLCSYSAVKEAFVKHGHAFSGRPQDTFAVKDLAKEAQGIVGSEGKVWKEQRQFTHSVLKDFGMGKSILEAKILEEIGPLVDQLKAHNELEMKMRYFLQCSVANIIFSIVFGHRKEYNDPRFEKYMKVLNEVFEVIGGAAPLTVFPYLKFVPGDPFNYHKVIELSDYMHSELRDMIAEHKKTYDEGEVRDYIDAYLKEMIKLDNDSDKSTFQDDQLVGVVRDLFVAGTDTTATTLQWALAYMIHYPEVQSRVQAEIDDVIGDQRHPSLQDKKNLPYTNACLLEVQRMADIVPLGLTHTTLEDVTFRGFNIPKGTMVMSNLYCVNRDEKVWKNPYDFDVERFLENGELKTTEQFIPFSMGKRSCLGESLAKMELFLFFTSILQQFTFSNPPTHDLPSLKGRLGITNIPPDFPVCASFRKA